MATREEIIEVIDAFLENRITKREAYDWASEAAEEAEEVDAKEDQLYGDTNPYTGEGKVSPLLK
jgi:hypothetical protein